LEIAARVGVADATLVGDEGQLALLIPTWQNMVMSMRELVETAGETESWVFSRAEARIYVVERGTGRPVVLLHGGPGGDHAALLPLMALASEFRVIAYDRRGSLRSPCELDQVTFQANVDDLAFLVSELDMGPVHLIGNSAGAHLAGAMVEQHPELVGHVALVAPAPLRWGAFAGATEHEQFEARMDWERSRPGKVLASMGLPDEPSELGIKERSQWHAVRDAALFLTRPERWRARYASRFYSPALSTRVVSTMPTDHDWAASLSAHHSPVSVIVGSDDLVDLGAKLAATYDRLPNINVTVIPDAGHDAWIDQPDIVDALLRTALHPYKPS
jgi:proline iminopeptidase